MRKKWGIEPVPDEPLRRVPNFWCHKCLSLWDEHMGKLFNSRQKLALITFVDKMREAYRRMVEEGYDEEYARGVVTYLGLAIDRLADYNSNICMWHTSKELLAHTFVRQHGLIYPTIIRLTPTNQKIVPVFSMQYLYICIT